jgi:small subunit ribosomal protein S6
MSIYEVMFILDPDLAEEGQEKVFTRLKTQVAKKGGEVFRMDNQGMRSLSYKINKKPRGRYFLCYIEGPGDMVSEIERTMKIDENIMRFIVIRMDDERSRQDFEVVEKEDTKVVAETPAPAEKPAAPETSGKEE